ncbi:MAG TPA: hypothetical protein PLP29_18840 [Candidatus Ozemobacteraceae bacterium]|nr:hypothetical protein [Candidatus Ozemobacteraceae bacterium]
MGIDAALRDRLLMGLQRLSLLYGELTEHARALLDIPEPLQEDVAQLLDHRDLALLEVKNVEQELVTALSAARPDQPATGLADVLKILGGEAIPALEAVARFRTALETLVETDRLFQKRISDAHAGIGAELARIRRSTSLVKGYRQSDPTGSAFIDKIK